ncbi:MAG: septal ring lytic transglycosylase RlpA family protein [Salinivirgaceae bacterium]|nr:septal ring lytic transglycosylase RlpA family protein [Salinivirgaceae bacterium]
MKLSKIIIISLFLIVSLVVKSQITEIGLASFYADKFDGRVTASGAIFNQKKLTAAHRTLPFGTTVKVTNLENSKTVEVTINDRGPFVNDRSIDLSRAAAEELDFIKKGVAKVKVEVIDLKKNSTRPVKHNVVKAKEEPKEEQATLTVTTSGVEYYKISSESIIPEGFGVQIASYQEAANLMKRCDELKKQINKDLIIQVAESNDSKVYRIVIGTFKSRDEAQEFNSGLKGKFNGSFVISF